MSSYLAHDIPPEHSNYFLQCERQPPPTFIYHMHHSVKEIRFSNLSNPENLNSLFVTNTTPNSTRSEVRVMTSEVEMTMSLAGTVGGKGVVVATRVGVMMRKEVTTMRMRARAMIRIENTTTRD